MYVIWETKLDVQASPRWGQSDDGFSLYQSWFQAPPPDLMNCFSRLILRFGKVEQLLSRAKDRPDNRVMVNGVMEALVEEPNIQLHLRSGAFVEHYGLLAQTLEGHLLTSLLGRLVREQNLLSVLQDRPFSEQSAQLYGAALKSAGACQRF